MLEPLKQFYCDSCNQLIEKPEDGWFEWLRKKDGSESINYNFRICHHSDKCMKYANHPKVLDNHLPNFLGELGFIQFLNFLDMGKTIIPENEYAGPRIENFREYTEILRRLFLPYYEEARQYWSIAESEGELINTNEVTLYLEYNLKNIIEKYSDQY